jgi:hypothetical protein
MHDKIMHTVINERAIVIVTWHAQLLLWLEIAVCAETCTQRCAGHRGAAADAKQITAAEPATRWIASVHSAQKITLQGPGRRTESSAAKCRLATPQTFRSRCETVDHDPRNVHLAPS